jgi:hypothetical protein
MAKQTNESASEIGRLTEFHLRCLEKRVGECNDALTEALSATCEAEIEAPGEEALYTRHSKRRKS